MMSPFLLFSPGVRMGSLSADGTGGVAPGSPTGFAATAAESAIELSWDALPEADTFDIVFSLEDNFGTASSLASGVTGTSFTHDAGESILVGEKYYYWIKAVNAGGESDYAVRVTARSFVTLTSSETRNLATPTGSWTVGTLFFRTSGVLPSSCIVAWNGGADIAASIGDGTWEDVINGGLYDPAISGAFEFDNQSGVSVTFWDTEP